MSLLTVTMIFVLLWGYHRRRPGATTFARAEPPFERDSVEWEQETTRAISEEFNVREDIALKWLTSRIKIEESKNTDDEPPQEQHEEGDGDEEEEPRQSVDGRTPTAIFYKDAYFPVNLNERYFVYQPSGGSSNQRIILENALIVGRALNRTVIVPQLAPHSSMWWNFNNFAAEDILSCDNVFDLERASRVLGVKTVVVPNGISYKRFILQGEAKFKPEWKRVEKGSARRLRPWTLESLIEEFQNEDSVFLHFAQTTMWGAFKFPIDVLNETRMQLRLTQRMRELAREMVREVFHDQPFNSLHIRFMDDGFDPRSLAENGGGLSPAPSFVYRMRAFDKSLPLFVATLPARRNDAYFNAFKSSGFRLVFGNALEQQPRIEAFLKSLPARIRGTMIGFIEQLVCARGEKFLGSGFSSFSEQIRRMRTWPQLVSVNEEDEQTLTPRTCRIPTRPC